MVRILGNLHDLVQGFTHSERLADRLNRIILKTAIKLVVLQRNNLFDQRELALFNRLNAGFASCLKTVVKLYETYSVWNRNSLIRELKKCQKLLHNIILNRQTRKSHERIDFVFNFASDLAFLKYIFDSKSSLNHAILRDIIVDLAVYTQQRLI
jgi:hypothetical protein